MSCGNALDDNSCLILVVMECFESLTMYIMTAILMRLNPCCNGIPAVLAKTSTLTIRRNCLNPCFNGIPAVHCLVGNKLFCHSRLNPCCNGMLWLRFRGWWCRGCFVLILVVMESLGSFDKWTYYRLSIVLILVVMESLGSISLFVAGLACLMS